MRPRGFREYSIVENWRRFLGLNVLVSPISHAPTRVLDWGIYGWVFALLVPLPPCPFWRQVVGRLVVVVVVYRLVKHTYSNRPHFVKFRFSGRLLPFDLPVVSRKR